ncbi:non-ribosomal peptide synthetase [Leptolyngbya sp. 7M]|uniref:non-ribosomal peptide synthetase n=1 Tax=Leptolyngbya sp. 7M TaxID=2812896 RepID=UPI001CEDBC3A|nr:amino acid adenylation domain-containing protein [Leptolyngbya sp. 7M]
MGLNPFLPDRFEFQVAQTPDRIAIVYQDRQLTYQELDSRANQLAHYLQAQGISTESRVGICMSRSPEMIIALLGVLKAGAAYVPLDPSYPTERLSWMIEDAQIDLLLTQTDISLTILSNIACRSCILDPHLDHNRQPIASYPAYPPKRTLSGLNLAYLIYTSGSTGKPKGTMLTHAGLSNYLDWCLQTYFSGNSLSNQFGAPVQSSISFDATITSLYPPLLVGQSIVLLPEQTELESLSQALALYPFSILKLTPAHLKLLSQWQASSDLQSNPSDLRANCHATVVIGGEALTAGHLTDWRSLAPHSQFVNEYGPTETVVGCCVYTIPADLDSSRTASIPIGRPIHNTELYILDSYLQPVPIGVPGELYIGGIGVGRGYFHRPDLTAARFIPNPFLASNASDTRLYKTGDRARYLADGTIEYLGRIDQQVKLRGFRIELEEIAAVLEQHPLVQAATVVVKTDEIEVAIPKQS